MSKPKKKERADRMEELIEITEDLYEEFIKRKLLIDRRITQIFSILFPLITSAFAVLMIWIGVTVAGFAKVELKDWAFIIIASGSLMVSLASFLIVSREMFSTKKKEVFDQYHKGIKNRINGKVNEDEEIVLRALLEMKVLYPKVKLLRLYKNYPSIFREEDLVRMLYQLPTSFQMSKLEKE
jgi:uncharacterized membrane protein